MPIISRPKSNISRNAAVRNAKNRKDQVPPMLIIPYSAATAAWLDAFQPTYSAAFDAVSEAKQTQTALTAQVTHAKQLAIYNEQDFVLNLNRAIRREVLQPTDRTYYGIAIDNDKALKVVSESDVKETNHVLTNGETNRLADGGAPITYPSIGEVNTAVANFVTLDNAQAPAKQNLEIKQEQLAALNDEADRLILKLWNETETTFDNGDKASMRNMAREWGVVYKPSAGEAPNPDEFSIQGKITQQGTTTGIEDAEIKVMETGNTYVSESNGDYLVAFLTPGTYTLQISKPGYTTQTLPGIIVTEGEITELNIALSVAAATGTVSGIVTQAALPVGGATVSVVGFPLLVTITNPAGEYTLNNIPPGMQGIIAQLPPVYGGGSQTQNINVVAGNEVNASFVF